MMENKLFLAKVKTNHFAISKSRHAVGEERRNGVFKIREVKRVDNPHPDEVYTVIGVTNLQEGESEWIGDDAGYMWTGKPVQVAILARSIGRRFKAFISDLKIVEDGDK